MPALFNMRTAHSIHTIVWKKRTSAFFKNMNAGWRLWINPAWKGWKHGFIVIYWNIKAKIWHFSHSHQSFLVYMTNILRHKSILFLHIRWEYVFKAPNSYRTWFRTKISALKWHPPFFMTVSSLSSLFVIDLGFVGFKASGIFFSLRPVSNSSKDVWLSGLFFMSLTSCEKHICSKFQFCWASKSSFETGFRNSNSVL